MKTPVVTRFYSVRAAEHRSVWARIWITDDGCLSILSDHGNYGYWWGNAGCEFRKFLCEVDDSYLMGKLSQGRVFPYQLQMFVKHLWPVFVEELKKELRAEAFDRLSKMDSAP